MIKIVNWPVVWICISSKKEGVFRFRESFINFYGVPEKINSDSGSALISHDYKMFYENENVEIEYSPPRLQTGTCWSNVQYKL